MHSADKKLKDLLHGCLDLDSQIADIDESRSVKDALEKLDRCKDLDGLCSVLEAQLRDLEDLVGGLPVDDPMPKRLKEDVEAVRDKLTALRDKLADKEADQTKYLSELDFYRRCNFLDASIDECARRLAAVADKVDVSDLDREMRELADIRASLGSLDQRVEKTKDIGQDLIAAGNCHDPPA